MDRFETQFENLDVQSQVHDDGDDDDDDGDDDDDDEDDPTGITKYLFHY